MRHIFFSITLLAASYQLTAQTAVTENPVIDRNFPDPTIVRSDDGRYYAYATEGNGHTIQVAVSDDLRQWKIAGDALPQKPAWANMHFWAPHVLFDKDIRKWVLFYSGESTDTTIGKCLGIAYADSPLGPFVDKGTPLLCGEGFVNIDPMAFVDPKSGRKLMYWGSGFKPIKVQEMERDWAGFKAGSKPKDLILPGKEQRYTRLLEGAWVTFEQEFYYLYYSGDNCCGEKASYAVLVARSRSATGPFETMAAAQGIPGSAILESDSLWNAPGHNSVIKDAQGQEWIFYHAIERKQPRSGGDDRRVMCRKRIVYKNGWPAVE